MGRVSSSVIVRTLAAWNATCAKRLRIHRCCRWSWPRRWPASAFVRPPAPEPRIYPPPPPRPPTTKISRPTFVRSSSDRRAAAIRRPSRRRGNCEAGTGTAVGDVFPRSPGAGTTGGPAARGQARRLTSWPLRRQCE